LPAPADGNGNKDVIDLDSNVPITCPDGTELDAHVGGWIQLMKYSGNGDKNIDHSTVHVEITYTDAEGGAFLTWTSGPTVPPLTRIANSSFRSSGGYPPGVRVGILDQRSGRSRELRT
jgi:hypothetical protein